MAGTIRHKSQNGWEVRSPVEAGVGIDVGDLLYQDASGYARPVHYLVGASGGANEIGEVLHGSYLGVACDARTGSETTDAEILVATDGFFRYPLETAAAAVAQIGDLIGAENNVITGHVEDQMVALIDPFTTLAVTINGAIGVLIKAVAIGDTYVECRLISSVMWGGVQSVI